MKRRELLKSGLLAGIVGLFSGKAFSNVEPEGKTVQDFLDKKPFYSPVDRKLGKAIGLQATSSYDIESVYMYGSLYEYPRYPAKVELNITYENGHESWTGFNATNTQLSEMTLLKFFKSKFVPDQHDIGGSVTVNNVKVQLASISYNN